MNRRLSIIIYAIFALGVFFNPHIIQAEEAVSTPAPTTTETVEKTYLIPKLSVDIPTVSFSKALETNGILSIDYLGDYISGMYKYLVGIGTTIAIVLVMVGGLQYALGGVDQGQIKKSKDRIRNAIVGLVLLLSTYAILTIANPHLTLLRPIEIEIIKEGSLAENEDDFVNGIAATSFQTPASSNIYGAAKSLVPEGLVADLEAVAKSLEEQGYGMSITSGYRSLKEQLRQIKLKCKNPPGSSTCDPLDGKTVACILRDNNPNNCPHTTGHALDVWGTKLGSASQCITQSKCNSKLGANDPCRKDPCQKALITAMRAQGFCNLSIEAWHFEKPKMSSRCK